MGLEKSIESGKEHRKPFKGAKAFAISCRNNGGKTKRRSHRECPWCRDDRLHNSKTKERAALEAQNDEFEYGHNVNYNSDE